VAEEKDRPDEAILTVLAARRRFNREMRKIDEAFRVLTELEERIPAPSFEEYRRMVAGELPLTREARLLMLMHRVTLTLERFLQFCSDVEVQEDFLRSARFTEILGHLVCFRAREKLEALLERIGRRQGGIGWKQGLGYLAWAALQGEEISLLHLTEEEKTELSRLAIGTEGWPWLREDDKFVGHLPLNQWKVLYARWRAAQAGQPGRPLKSSE